MSTIVSLNIPPVLESKSEYGFTCLYNQYSPMLYGLIIKITEDDGIANDILQASFLKIWAAFDYTNNTSAGLLNWMTAITIQQCSETLNLSRTQLLNKLMPKAVVLKMAN